MRSDLLDRTDDFNRNVNDEVLGDAMNIRHQLTFLSRQAALRKNIFDWYANGCGGGGYGELPADVWSLATRPVPAPNQDPARQKFANHGGGLFDWIINQIDHFEHCINGCQSDDACTL